jgi:uncharacterized protein YjbJ (UPF0337 family)
MSLPSGIAGYRAEPTHAGASRARIGLPFEPMFAEMGAGNQAPEGNERKSMGIVDKATGRIKKAAGDIKDDPKLRRKGRQEERKGEAKEERDRAREQADKKAAEVSDLERKT